MHWEAHFFLTDEAPYEEELLQVLAGYKDRRLMYLPIGMEHRPKVSRREIEGWREGGMEGMEGGREIEGGMEHCKKSCTL